MHDKKIGEIADALCKELAKRGKVIEGGWEAFKLTMIPVAEPQHIVDDLRDAYWAGCQHLWATIMNILDPGSEPTDDDMDVMGKINDELDNWARQKHAEMDRKKQ